MSKMTPSELKAMLAAEKADALAAVTASKLSAERADAMDYYLGDMSKDMPAQDGRSRAVSTDVADTIEGLMPSLMDVFAASDEIVRFEPFGPEDVQAAEQETDYVNHVFMQQNPGFLILYSFIKDALLSKVGVVKVWWEEREQEERETYLDQPDEAFALLVADPEVEVVEHSASDDPSYRSPLGADPSAPRPQLHDVTVVTRRTYQCARVEGVPPEEFGIARNARSIRDAGYCFHEVLKAESDLIGQGYDADQIRALPSHGTIDNNEKLARDTVDESVGRQGDETVNRANRLIRITEHYVRMDYRGNGKAALYRVTTGGDQGDILRRADELEIVPADVIPFAAMTPVIVTHRFFGRSIADLVMDIQRIKTALIRAILDNAYLAVNPRVEVSESHATETTLDDLLVSRPGGVVRTKMPGGINWQTVPSIAAAIFPVLEYADATREWRTGVTRQGQGIDANALQNQSATAVNQAFTAAQARMKLIARIFAETGIRDLFGLLHATIRKHGTRSATVRLRNQWVMIDPRDWKSRNDMTINVGLGTGGKSERLAHMLSLIGLQKEAMAGGLSNLVSAENLYNSAKEVVKLLDLKNVDQFFTDPKTQAPPQPRPDPKLIEIQARAQLEKVQAEADVAAQNNKVQSELALAQQRFVFEKEIKLLEHGLRVRDLQFRHLQGAVGPTGADDVEPSVATDGDAESPAPAGGGTNAMAPIIMELIDHLRRANAPKRIVRDAQGRVSHIEPMIDG
jgi:hypothetical protein